MKVYRHTLHLSVICGIIVLCAAVFVTNATTAGAGINVWTSHGPEGLPVVALAVDPTAPDTLYAATGAVGGVFESGDGGGSWQPINAGLPPEDSVQALAIAPTTPGTVYAGTRYVGGMFKSSVGGAWNAASTGLPGSASVTALALDPTEPHTLYAVAVTCRERSCTGSVFKSTDAGGSWQSMNMGLPNDLSVNTLALDPATPTTLYAGFESCRQQGGCSGMVFKSTDGASTWSLASAELPRVAMLAVDPITPGTIYAITRVCPISGGGLVSGVDDCPSRVFKSTTGGGSWIPANTGTLPAVRVLAIDPITSGTLYAGTDGGVFKSTDGASTWQGINVGLPDTQISALVIDPDTPSTLYAGTVSGVFSLEQVAVVGSGTADSCTDAALNSALAAGGLVTFNCGTDPVTIDISTGTGTKTIEVDTTIDGGGLITISGGLGIRAFVVDSGVNFTVNHLTIANGFVGGGGGGIKNDGSLRVTNSTFTGNIANIGGGAVYNDGTLAVSNSTFTTNSAPGSDEGGRGRGGAIYNDGTLAVSNSTFTGNVASVFKPPEGLGGGHGGAIFNAGATTVTNSTVSGNVALGFVGRGGGIFNDTSGTVVLRNTIVANSDCSGTITDGGHNVDDGTSCGFSTANGSLSNASPQLDPAGLHDNGGPTQTVALCTGVGEPDGCIAASPAIDTGDQAACDEEPVSNLDQRGFARPGIGHTQCSIGAYEADATAPARCVGDCNGSSRVTVDELVRGVNMLLSDATPDQCQAFDCNGNGHVTVDCLVQAVNSALRGCGVVCSSAGVCEGPSGSG